MKRMLVALMCLCPAVMSIGCALCYTPYDDHYGGYGGVQERQDPVHGRAGSILSDPAFQYSETSALSEEATESDLYRLEADAPQLEIIEPQPTPAELGN